MVETYLAVFRGKNVRKTVYKKEWWFSVIDVVKLLVNQSDDLRARKYWNKLAQRLRDEGSQVVTNCHRLKLIAMDRKLQEMQDEPWRKNQKLKLQQIKII